MPGQAGRDAHPCDGDGAQDAHALRAIAASDVDDEVSVAPLAERLGRVRKAPAARPRVVVALQRGDIPRDPGRRVPVCTLEKHLAEAHVLATDLVGQCPAHGVTKDRAVAHAPPQGLLGYGDPRGSQSDPGAGVTRGRRPPVKRSGPPAATARRAISRGVARRRGRAWAGRTWRACAPSGGSTWPVEVGGPAALTPWPRGCNGLRGHGHRDPTRPRARQQPARDRAVARGAAHEPRSAHLLLILGILRLVRHRGARRPGPIEEMHPQMRAVLVKLHHHREDLYKRARGGSAARLRRVAAWVCCMAAARGPSPAHLQQLGGGMGLPSQLQRLDVAAHSA